MEEIEFDVLKDLKSSVKRLMKKARCNSTSEVLELKKNKIYKKEGFREKSKRCVRMADYYRKKAYNYMRTSSFLDCVIDKLERVLKKGKDETIFDVVKTIEAALKTDDPSKISRVVGRCEDIVENAKIGPESSKTILRKMIEKENLDLDFASKK